MCKIAFSNRYVKYLVKNVTYDAGNAEYERCVEISIILSYSRSVEKLSPDLSGFQKRRFSMKKVKICKKIANEKKGVTAIYAYGENGKPVLHELPRKKQFKVKYIYGYKAA